MKKQIIVCAAVVAASVGAAAIAHAQYAPIYPRAAAPEVPPHQVMVIVRSTGMRPLSRPLRRGPNYVVIASTRSGARMRVVIDAYDGAILRMRPARLTRLYRQPYRPLYAPPLAGPPGAIGMPPVPPRNVPGPRIANAPAAVPPTSGAGPHASDSIPPWQTPLPRPRPKVASRTDVTGSTSPVSKPPAPARQSETKPAPETANPAQTAPSPHSSGDLKLVPVAPLE